MQSLSPLNDDQRGICLVLLGMLMFSIQDMLIKMFADVGSLLQIVIIRGIVGIMIISAYMWYRRGKLNWGSVYPLIAFSRALLFTFGFLSFYMSLTFLPLAVATSLFFISPFFMTLLSTIILKTPIGWYRMTALVCGFIGVALIVKPTSGIFHWASLLPIATAFSYSLSMILAKKTSDKDMASQQSIHVYFGAVIFCSLFSFGLGIHTPTFLQQPELAYLVREWQWDHTGFLLAVASIAVVGSFGILLLVNAYRIAEPSAIAPFEYFLIISALIGGFLLFGEHIDPLSLLGMAIIVASGIYIFVREKIRKRPVTLDTSLRT